MPADFVFKLFMLLSMFNLVASWLISLAMLSGKSSPAYFAWETAAQRSSIHRRIWILSIECRKSIRWMANSVFTRIAFMVTH